MLLTHRVPFYNVFQILFFVLLVMDVCFIFLMCFSEAVFLQTAFSLRWSAFIYFFFPQLALFYWL